MSMRTREGGTILSAAMERKGWDRSTDPGSLLVKMPEPKQPPICHCQPPVVGQIGGMNPCIDRVGSRVVCRSCLKEIGPACRHRQVVHLRGLIALDQKNPQNVDWEDIEAAGWLLDVSQRHSPSTQATYLDTC